MYKRQVVYDEGGKVAKWTLGKLADDPAASRNQLTVNIKLQPNKAQDETNPSKYDSAKHRRDLVARSPNLSLHWKIPLASVSGLTVSGLSLSKESYKPYKGVRNITKSGLYQIRCS